jgi:hypothetical protein
LYYFFVEKKQRFSSSSADFGKGGRGGGKLGRGGGMRGRTHSAYNPY